MRNLPFVCGLHFNSQAMHPARRPSAWGGPGPVRTYLGGVISPAGWVIGPLSVTIRVVGNGAFRATGLFPAGNIPATRERLAAAALIALPIHAPFAAPLRHSATIFLNYFGFVPSAIRSNSVASARKRRCSI